MAKDYYHILGVDKKASKDEIKKAFYKLAHKYHPDKKDGNEEKFKEVSEAYAVLSDDNKRAQYDTYGQAFNGGQPGAGGAGGFDFSGFAQGGGFQDFDLGDIFGEFFGGGGGRRERVRRGRDISIDLELSFSESVFGTERTVLLSKTSQCDTCRGSGGKPDTEMKTCPVCSGKGRVEETRNSFFGSFTSVITCKECRGAGKIPKEKCPTCSGAGVTKKQEEITIRVPAGISNAEMIRMTGQGEAIADGIPGDLYVKIHVKKHPTFRKEGADLRMELNIKLTDALLGAEHSVTTLDGDITLKIPPGVTFGDVLRVKGKGVPVSKSKRGDILVRLNIHMPSKLSKKEKQLLEDLKKEGL